MSALRDKLQLSLSHLTLWSQQMSTRYKYNVLLMQDRGKKGVQSSSMGPPQNASRSLPDVGHESSFVPGYRQEPQVDTQRDKEREREKARPRLGPQELPPKLWPRAQHQSTLHWRQTGVNNGRGEGWRTQAAGPKQSSLAPWLPVLLLLSPGLCSHSEGHQRASLGGWYNYACSAVTQGKWPGETSMYPSDCCSCPPAALHVFQQHLGKVFRIYYRTHVFFEGWRKRLDSLGEPIKMARKQIIDSRSRK